MDVERTIEYILDMQAKAEVRMAKADERAAKADERMDKFDRRLEAMRKLIETDMRMLSKRDKEHAEFKKEFEEYKIESKKDFDRRIKEITDIQKRTDLKLDRLIDAWGKQRTNGHPGRKKPE
jgi:vacuolar-type H+-ATPase subunit B/Vma2